jgi:hypothetical protein
MSWVVLVGSAYPCPVSCCATLCRAVPRYTTLRYATAAVCLQFVLHVGAQHEGLCVFALHKGTRQQAVCCVWQPLQQGGAVLGGVLHSSGSRAWLELFGSVGWLQQLPGRVNLLLLSVPAAAAARVLTRSFVYPCSPVLVTTVQWCRFGA